jgi:hypothetical protein
VEERIDSVPFLFGDYMNAKIVITVPIDNIPDEVSKIVERLVENISSVKEKMSNCTYNDNHTTVIEEIDAIRKSLSLIDNNLEDCYSILLGYVKYNTEQKIKLMQDNVSKVDNNQESDNG